MSMFVSLEEDTCVNVDASKEQLGRNEDLYRKETDKDLLRLCRVLSHKKYEHPHAKCKCTPCIKTNMPYSVSATLKHTCSYTQTNFCALFVPSPTPTTTFLALAPPPLEVTMQNFNVALSNARVPLEPQVHRWVPRFWPLSHRLGLKHLMQR